MTTWSVIDETGRIVEGPATDRFSPAVTQMTLLDDNNDGIFEPGSTVTIPTVSWTNVGGLTTPAGTSLGLACQKFAQPLPSHQPVTLGPCAPNQRQTVKTPCFGAQLVTYDPQTDLAQEPFLRMAYFQSHLSMLGRPFFQGKVPITIPVQFPVRLTQLNAPDLLGPGEYGKILISVKNISLAPYGVPVRAQSLPRSVRVELRLSGYIEVESHDSDDGSVELVAVGYTQSKDKDAADSDGVAEEFVCALNFASLQPGETKTVTLRVRMKNEAVAAAYSNVTLNSTLYFWSASPSLQTCMLQPIQRMRDRIRVVPCFDSKNFYDLLLVTSKDIDRPEYLAYAHVAQILGLTMTTWDVVRYQGFSAAPALSWVGRCMTVIFLTGPNQHHSMIRHADVRGHFRNPMSSILVVGSNGPQRVCWQGSNGADYADGSFPSLPFSGGVRDFNHLLYNFLDRPIGTPALRGSCCHNVQEGCCRTLCCAVCCGDERGAGCMKRWCSCCIHDKAYMLARGDEQRRLLESSDPIRKPHVAVISDVKPWARFQIGCFSAEDYGTLSVYRSVVPASANFLAIPHASNGITSSMMSRCENSPFKIASPGNGLPSQLVPTHQDGTVLTCLDKPFGRIFLSLLSLIPMHSVNYLLLQPSQAILNLLRFRSPPTPVRGNACLPCCTSQDYMFGDEGVSTDIRFRDLAAAVVADRLRRSLAHCPADAPEYVTASLAQAVKINPQRFLEQKDENAFAPLVAALRRVANASGVSSSSSKRDKMVRENMTYLTTTFDSIDVDESRLLDMPELWRSIGFACGQLNRSVVPIADDALRVDFATWPASKRPDVGHATVTKHEMDVWVNLQRRPGPVPVGKEMLFAAPIHPGLLWAHDIVYDAAKTGEGDDGGNVVVVTVGTEGAVGADTPSDSVYDAEGRFMESEYNMFVQASTYVASPTTALPTAPSIDSGREDEVGTSTKMEDKVMYDAMGVNVNPSAPVCWPSSPPPVDDDDGATKKEVYAPSGQPLPWLPHGVAV